MTWIEDWTTRRGNPGYGQITVGDVVRDVALTGSRSVFGPIQFKLQFIPLRHVKHMVHAILYITWYMLYYISHGTCHIIYHMLHAIQYKLEAGTTDVITDVITIWCHIKWPLDCCTWQVEQSARMVTHPVMVVTLRPSGTGTSVMVVSVRQGQDRDTRHSGFCPSGTGQGHPSWWFLSVRDRTGTPVMVVSVRQGQDRDTHHGGFCPSGTGQGHPS